MTVSLDSRETELSPEEQEQFSDSHDVIMKIAKREANKQVNAALEQVSARLAALEAGIKTTSTAVVRRDESDFNGKVKAAVSNFDAVVMHPKWKEFTDSKVPMAGISYAQAIAVALRDRNLEQMVDIFKAFSDKHIEPTKPNGYDAPDTSAAGSDTPPPSNPTTAKLPFSKRKKASEDLLKGRIERSEFDKIYKEYKEAEEKGLIDYDA
jgi:hypothetical protein